MGVECVPWRGRTVIYLLTSHKRSVSWNMEVKEKLVNIGNEYIISDKRTISSGESCH